MNATESLHITTAARYKVTQAFADFEQAVQAVVGRVDQEGLQSVLNYQFYGSPQSENAGALFTYGDANSWLRHHEIVPQWQELQAFQAAVELESDLLYGELSPEISTLLRNANIPYTHLGSHVAGFVRHAPPRRDKTAAAQLTTVTQYELAKPRDEYEAAIQELARRTEQEGHQDVLTYQFYQDPKSPTAGGVIIYADDDAFVEHHQIVARWEELATFKATHRLLDIVVYGQVGASAEGFLKQADLLDRHIGPHIAGFERN